LIATTSCHSGSVVPKPGVKLAPSSRLS
jgi:hypothetical protein